MYEVITAFIDLVDGRHEYAVGDTYPREGHEPTAERIEFLLSDTNKVGKPVIKEVTDVADEEKPDLQETEDEPAQVTEDEVKPKKTRKRA